MTASEIDNPLKQRETERYGEVNFFHSQYDHDTLYNYNLRHLIFFLQLVFILFCSLIIFSLKYLWFLWQKNHRTR